MLVTRIFSLTPGMPQATASPHQKIDLNAGARGLIKQSDALTVYLAGRPGAIAT